MSITRLDPLGDAIGLRQVMDSLLEQSFVRPRTDTTGAPFGLAVDVADLGDAYVVEAAIPGSSPEDVEISVIGDMVRLRAERREERQEGDRDGRWLVREQRYGVFERAVRLPTPVDAGAAQAIFQDGVLRITLPKAQASREQRIPVSAGNGQAGRAQEVEASGQGQGDQGDQGGQSGKSDKGGGQRNQA